MSLSKPVSRFNELERVASFKDCQFRAPADHAYACRLARHGFYSESDGRLACMHCRQVVPESSAVSEDPLERHRRLNPDCPAFTGALPDQRPESPNSILEGMKRNCQTRDLTTDGDEENTRDNLLNILKVPNGQSTILSIC